MGRVNRLLERRALRRAADQALLTTLGNTTPSDAGGRPDQDFKYNRVEPAETAASYDHEPTTDPIPVVEADDLAPGDYGWPHEDDAPAAESIETPSASVDVYDLVPDQPDEPHWDGATEVAEAEQAVSEPLDDYAWDTPSGWDTPEEVPPPAPAHVRPTLRARPVAEGAYVQPALDFTVTGSQPWYRTKPAAVVLVAAVIAAVVCGGWLAFRSPTRRPNSRPSGADECTAGIQHGCADGSERRLVRPRLPRHHLLLRHPRRRRPSPRIPRHNGSTRRVTPSRPRRRSRGST